MKLTGLKKTVAIIGAVTMIGASLAGCGSKASNNKNLDADAVIMKVGDEEVKFSEAYFLVKWQQANYQNVIAYNGSYGDDWYAQDIFGTGESFQDYFKDYYEELLTRICIARDKMDEYGLELTEEEKADIESVVKEFIDANSDEALNAMLADEDVVRQVLTDYKILEKVAAKEVEDINTDISDEELKEAAYTRTYDYIYISFETTDENGNSTTITAAEQEDYINQLNIVRSQTIEKGDFDAAAEDAGQTVSSHTYTPGATASEDRLYQINNYMDGLEIGEVSEVIPLDTTGVILAYMASDNTDKLNDEDTLNTARESILSERKLDKFQEVVKNWKSEYNIDNKTDLWDKITMEEPLAAASSSSTSSK